MLKKFLFLIILFNFTISNFSTLAEIIPLKKPVLSKEETQKKLLFDVIKPLPKPTKKTEIKTVKKKVSEKTQIKDGLILPKKNRLY